jgi:iron(III) transport system permease protein
VTRPGRWAWGGAGGLVALSLLLVLVMYPLFELFSTAAEQGWEPVRQALAGQGTTRAVLDTIGVGVAVAVLAVAGGTAGALVTERSGVPGRRWLRAGVLLPLLVPPFAAALGMADAYGPAGLSDDLLGLAVPGLYGPVGVVLAITIEAMPLAYLIVAAGLATRAEPELERAARVSGASAVEVLRTITLPLLRPATRAAAVLAFVTAANSFAVPAVLGIPAGFPTMTTRIYESLNFAADQAAFTEALMLAAVLVVIALAVVGAADLPRVGDLIARGSAPAGALVAGRPSRAARAAAAVLWSWFALVTAVPLLALVLTALTRAIGVAPVPANWTLANFSRALAGGHASAGLTRSLLLGAASASVLLALGGLVAFAERRRGGGRLGTLVTLTFAVPGSALAVAVLLAYGRWLGGSLLIIFLAYLAKLWALGHRPIAGSLDRLPPELIWAARTSGAGAATTLRTIVAPILRPALVGTWLLVFLSALHELTISSLLYGPGNETLAVVVLNLQQVGDVSATSALAFLLTLLVGAAVIPLLASGRRLGRRSGWR